MCFYPPINGFIRIYNHQYLNELPLNRFQIFHKTKFIWFDWMSDHETCTQYVVNTNYMLLFSYYSHSHFWRWYFPPLWCARDQIFIELRVLRTKNSAGYPRSCHFVTTRLEGALCLASLPTQACSRYLSGSSWHREVVDIRLTSVRLT